LLIGTEWLASSEITVNRVQAQMYDAVLILNFRLTLLTVVLHLKSWLHIFDSIEDKYAATTELT